MVQSASTLRSDRVIGSIPGEFAEASAQVSRWGVFILLAFAVLAFGAVERWATAVLELGSCLLFAFTIVPVSITGEIRRERNPILIPIALWCGVIGIQVLFHITSYWFASYCALLKVLSYAALFVVASRVFTTNSARMRFAMFASIFGGAVALFAMLQDFTANGALYWLHVPESSSHIFGPYVNRNHYAGLMEMLTPFSFAIALRFQSPRRELLLFLGALMAASIFLSGSRGGMLAFIGEGLFVFVLMRRQQNSRARLLVWASAVCVAILVCWLGSSELFSRFAPVGFTAESTIGRAAIYRDSVRMLPGHWLLGWGAGTFSEVFPHFRSSHSDLLVNEVHNDYLQTLIETGIVGFAALLSFLVMLCRCATRILVHETSDRSRSLRMAALTGCTGLLIHGLWDFNLQIPANAAWFFVLAAMASGAIQGSREFKARHALDKEEANIPAYRR